MTRKDDDDADDDGKNHDMRFVVDGWRLAWECKSNEEYLWIHVQPTYRAATLDRRTRTEEDEEMGEINRRTMKYETILRQRIDKLFEMFCIATNWCWPNRNYYKTVFWAGRRRRRRRLVLNGGGITGIITFLHTTIEGAAQLLGRREVARRCDCWQWKGDWTKQPNDRVEVVVVKLKKQLNKIEHDERRRTEGGHGTYSWHRFNIELWLKGCYWPGFVRKNKLMFSRVQNQFWSGVGTCPNKATLKLSSLKEGGQN